MRNVCTCTRTFITSKSRERKGMYPSKSAYNPQAFDSFWKPFIRFFQALCQSHYSTFYFTKHFGRLIYFIAFSVCDILTNLYTIQIVWMMDKKQFKNSCLMYFVSFLSIIMHIIVHSMCHFESIATRKEENEIYRRYREIDEIFALKLGYVQDFSAIRKNCISPVVYYWIFGGAVSFITSLYSIPTDESMLVQIIFTLLHTSNLFINRSRRCQVSIHISFLTHTLIDLKVLLERQHRDDPLKPNSLESIRYLRDIYSSAWLITKLINKCFGWTLVFILIEFTVDLINSSYQFYLNIRIYKSNFQTIRNYCSSIGDKYFIFLKINFNRILFHFRNHSLSGPGHFKLLVLLYARRALRKCGKGNNYFSIQELSIWIYLLEQGKKLQRALHSASFNQDPNYYRHIRLFSLQLRKLPIKMQMKEMFTFNYAILKSVTIKSLNCIYLHLYFTFDRQSFLH